MLFDPQAISLQFVSMMLVLLSAVGRQQDCVRVSEHSTSTVACGARLTNEKEEPACRTTNRSEKHRKKLIGAIETAHFIPQERPALLVFGASKRGELEHLQRPCPCVHQTHSPSIQGFL